MKLAEIETELIQRGFSEELFAQFTIALKRVRGNFNRCQHCYITAYQLKGRDLDGAVRMIQYGLEHFAEGWIDFYRSYENLAGIYLRENRYAEAKGCYLAELEKMREFKQARYADALSVSLVYVELHCSDFAYTEELRDFYCLAATDVAGTGFLRRERFYCALAELVIALHDGNRASARRAYAQVTGILNGTDSDPNDGMFARHRYANAAGATAEAKRFLNRMEKLLKT